MTAGFSATVQASSNVAGRGTVAIVEVHSGTVHVGGHVVIEGRAGQAAEVLAVEVFAADEPEDDEPVVQQLGLLLSGIDKADVPRGSGVTASD
ncbi:MAG: hypothetical protein QOK05_1503 [Chloroflexota bacterium]|jgi:elongation factor Tu|nr:hypothetical protein [Chloroflexota bacterium]